jgi:ribosomal protein L37AE/L43A
MKIKDVLNEGMTFNPVVEKSFTKGEHAGETYWTGSDWERKEKHECPDCKGTGKGRYSNGEFPCVFCGGKGYEEETFSDAPELSVSNANGKIIQEMLGLDPDYSGVIHNKDLSNIMRRLILLKNKGAQQYTREPKQERGPTHQWTDDHGITHIGRGPTMHDYGLSQDQINKYVDRLIQIIQFAQKNNASLGWG